MAHNGTAEGFASAECRQTGGICKRPNSNDRVVAPVITLCAMPPADAINDERAVNAAGELLKSREQRVRIHDHRQRLDKTNARMAFHCVYKAHDGVARHQAIRVENDHRFIASAKPSYPLRDISSLAALVVGAMSVEDLPAATGAILDAEKLFFLFNPDFRIG